MLDKLNKTIIDSDELAELVAERDKLAAMCGEAIKHGEKLADERDRVNVLLAETVDALQGVTRILEAFRSSTQFGRTQKERLDKAQAVIKKARGP
jgi:hypothetical protein